MENVMCKKVSIILPVYNGEENIAKAIESVLCQTYKNIELIIVNDCSTDGTAEIVERYAASDDRIKVIDNPVNLKLPKSLNIGFSYARGEYFTWTSDDNLYRENAIERMVISMEEDASIDMVYANYMRINAEGDVIGISKLAMPEALRLGNVIGACFLYTRTIAEIVGEYDNSLFLAEDYDYWIRIFRVGKIRRIDEVLYYYRQHDKSLSATKRKQVEMQAYQVLEKNFFSLATYSETTKDKYAFYDYMLFRVRDNSDKYEEVRKKINRLDKGYAKASFVRRIRRKLRIIMRMGREKQST